MEPSVAGVAANPQGIELRVVTLGGSAHAAGVGGSCSGLVGGLTCRGLGDAVLLQLATAGSDLKLFRGSICSFAPALQEP